MDLKNYTVVKEGVGKYSVTDTNTGSIHTVTSVRDRIKHRSVFSCPKGHTSCVLINAVILFNKNAHANRRKPQNSYYFNPNAPQGSSGISLTPCPCCEVGQDGTNNHTEGKFTTFTLGTYFVIRACPNHTNNYASTSSWQEIPAPVIPTKNAKSVLSDMVEVLNHGTDDSRNLWNVLTALRGPDSGNDKLKENTTCRIRGALGLKGGFGAMVSQGKPVYLDLVGGYRTLFDQLVKDYKTAVQFHFVDHYGKALKTLLKWEYIK